MRAYFSGPLTFLVCPYDGRRLSVTEYARAHVSVIVRDAHSYTDSRCSGDDNGGDGDGGGGSTSILPHVTLFSILTTAARERADVFFFPGTK